MAKEYIEREAAIKELCQVSAPIPSESYIVEKCIDKIDNMSAADVVEVVRCKDCTYWGGKYASNECSLITQLANPDYWLKTASDDFCSSGKRKGN